MPKAVEYLRTVLLLLAVPAVVQAEPPGARSLWTGVPQAMLIGALVGLLIGLGKLFFARGK